MKKWQIAVLAVAVVAVALGALFGGRAWGAGRSSTDRDQFAGNRTGPGISRGDGSIPAGGFGGGRNGGNMVSGSIIAVDESSITIQTSDGSTKIVLFSGSTSVSLTTQGSVADLKTGENVVIAGTTNTDGTVTATNVRLGETLGAGVAPDGTPPPGNTPSASETSTTLATATQ